MVTCLTWAMRLDVACVILMCFCGLLRVGEVLQLSIADVHFVGPYEVVLVLGTTKRVSEEKVMLTNPGVVAWWLQYRLLAQGSGATRFCLCSYSKVRGRSLLLVGVFLLGIFLPPGRGMRG